MRHHVRPGAWPRAASPPGGGPSRRWGTPGVPLSVYLEVDSPGRRQMLWHDRRLIDGGTRLDFDSIRHTTLRPFGLLVIGPAAVPVMLTTRITPVARGGPAGVCEGTVRWGVVQDIAARVAGLLRVRLWRHDIDRTHELRTDNPGSVSVGAPACSPHR